MRYTTHGKRRPCMVAGALTALLALLLCCAVLAACAGQGVEVRPRGQAVIGVGTGGH